MSALDDYFQTHAARLRAAFDVTRARFRDPGLKGAGNEGILADFLRQHLAPSPVLTNAEIIDTHGRRSDEVDIAVCNAYQPFITPEPGQLLIVEGVDIVIQVKARLTTTELDRILRNCRSVKELTRTLQDGAIVRVHFESDIPHTVDRPLYLAFCFESELTLATACQRLIKATADIPSELQPDGLFVLDRGMIKNVRENTGAIRVRPTTIRGFAYQESPEVLLDLLQDLFVMRNPITHPFHPLESYWQQ